MIGAGVCKTPASTAEWLKVAPAVSGSYTKEQRDGNPGKVLYPETIEEFLRLGYGLNSYGMPNMGFAAAAKQFATMESDQPLIASVAGFCIDDYVHGMRVFGQHPRVSAVELNFGCPNTQGEHSTIISFDPGTINTIVHQIMKMGFDTPVWIKLSPYSNPQDLQQVAKVLNRFVGKGTFHIAVVTCNTFPNAYAGDGKISPNNGMAGLSGPAMKPIALGQVKQFRQHLDERIDVIGVNGITTGNDIIDFLEAGAQAVQITSLVHWMGDPRRFLEHLLTGERSTRLVEYLTNDA
jgi:dihydroorotate dehydrogenase (fumarate)